MRVSLQAYQAERRRATIRMWIGFAAANAACIGAMLLLIYV